MIRGLLLSMLLPLAVAAGSAGIPGNCPVTRPPDRAFVPPPPHSPQPPWAGRFWYGTEDLWAMPSSDGLWHGRTTRGGIGNKVFFWSRHWDWRTELEPELVLTATRLDEQARSVRVTPATNAHGSDIRHAILSGLTLPAPGCWQLTADYSGYTLSYVVWVE